MGFRPHQVDLDDILHHKTVELNIRDKLSLSEIDRTQLVPTSETSVQLGDKLSSPLQKIVSGSFIEIGLLFFQLRQPSLLVFFWFLVSERISVGNQSGT